MAGVTWRGLGGSIYNELEKSGNNALGVISIEESAKLYRGLLPAFRAGLVMAAHDISDGGFAAAAAEMAFGGSLGADLSPETGYAQDGISQAELLFGESPSRILLEVDKDSELAFRSLVAGLPVERVGFVSSGHDLTLLDGAGRELLREDIAVLLECWSGGEI